MWTEHLNRKTIRPSSYVNEGWIGSRSVSNKKEIVRFSLLLPLLCLPLPRLVLSRVGCGRDYLSDKRLQVMMGPKIGALYNILITLEVECMSPSIVVSTLQSNTALHQSALLWPIMWKAKIDYSTPYIELKCQCAIFRSIRRRESQILFRVCGMSQTIIRHELPLLPCPHYQNAQWLIDWWAS